MKKRICNLMINVFIIYFSITSCDHSEEENFKVYDFLNHDYLPLLDQDTFPRNISDRILDIKYGEEDTIIVNKLKFNNPGNHQNHFFETSSKWNFDSLKKCRRIDSIIIAKFASNNLDTFKSNFGQGFIILSQPIISKKFLLLKEYRIRSSLSESYDNQEFYVIFEKKDHVWKFKDKILKFKMY
jgi:hypothetical protein